MVAPRFGSEPKPGEKGVSSSPPIGASAIHGLAVRQPADQGCPLYPQSGHAHRRHQCLLCAISGFRRKGIETGSAPSKQLGTPDSAWSPDALTSPTSWQLTTSPSASRPTARIRLRDLDRKPGVASGSTHPSQADAEMRKVSDFIGSCSTMRARHRPKCGIASEGNSDHDLEDRLSVVLLRGSA